MTDDLVQWLHAQLDEDQRIAEAARDQSSAQWHHDTSYDNGYVYDENRQAVVYDEGTPAHEEAEHIAAHDPARVLREIEATRQILARYVDAAKAVAELTAVRERLHAGGKDLLMTEMDLESAVHRRDTLHGVLRLLALPFADRPGFQESWRP